VAVIMDWEARWAMEVSDGVSRMEGADCYMKPVFEFHRMFWKQGLGTDVIESTCDLSGYTLVVAPQLYLLKPGVAEALKTYVQEGGTLLLTCFSGVVNESNLCFRGGFPGEGLREFCGVWSEEWDFLHEGETQTVEMSPGNSLGMEGTFRTQRKLEVLHEEGAEVLATVTTDFYAGHPILTCKQQGRGRVYYLGAHMQEDFMDALGPALTRTLGISRVIETDLPHGVTAQMRTDGNRDFVFLQNFTAEGQTVDLDSNAYTCMETGDPVPSPLTLEGWNSRILVRKTG
jgi:beta-galactosidase